MPGQLVDKLQTIIDGNDTVGALKAVMDELVKVGDSADGIQPTPTLVACKQVRLALEECE